VLLPVASELGARREDERLRNVLVTATRVTLAGFLPVACALAVFARPFLTAWVGPRYGGDADVLVILLAAGAVDVALWPAGYILVGIGRHRMLALFAGTSALANLGLSIALVGPLGTKGVALGTLIATTAEASLLVVPYVLRLTGLRPLRALTEVLLPAVIPLLPEVAVLYGIDRLLAPGGLPVIVLAGAAGGVVYLLVFLRFQSCRAERAVVAQAARRGAFLLARTAGGATG
jgi:O-antigen/teichoic acid export membrane protein